MYMIGLFMQGKVSGNVRQTKIWFDFQDEKRPVVNPQPINFDNAEE